MIYLVHGKNQYESWQEVNRLKQDFLSKNSDGEIENFAEDGRISFANIGFFNRPKLWVVKRLLQMPAALQESIWKDINSLKDLEIIIWEDKPADKRTKIYKEVTKKYVVREFNLLKGAELSKWIAAQLEKNKIIKSERLIQLLAFRYGHDQNLLLNELSKLRLLLDSEGRNEIKEDDFSILSSTDNFDIWEFVDSFFAKDKRKAINSIDRLRMEDKEEISILAGIGSGLKAIFLMLKYGPHAESYAKDLGIHPYVFSKSKVYARNFTLSRIERLYEQILNLDFTFKRSELDPKMGLELLIASL